MSSSESIVDTFTGWAAKAPGAPLEPHSYDPGPLGAEEVEVAVEYCGIPASFTFHNALFIGISG